MALRERGPKVSVRFKPDELRALRTRDKLTQEELAAQAGIDGATVRRAEKGVAVSLETALDIVSVLSADLASISDYADRSSDLSRPLHSVATTKELPRTLSLTTKRANPQWADYRDWTVGIEHPWTLRCTVQTDSPYFRFGFKLLGQRGRVFGDGLIQSYDTNLVIHIGRNDWDRPRMGITARDVFLTTYMNGIAIEDDTSLFRAEQILRVPVELQVDETYRMSLSVNGHQVSQRIIPPTICNRIVILAWGDRDEFQVDVTGLRIDSGLS